MCYSKEVQLVTGSIILLSCLFYYLYFKLKFAQYIVSFYRIRTILFSDRRTII